MILNIKQGIQNNFHVQFLSKQEGLKMKQWFLKETKVQQN